MTATAGLAPQQIAAFRRDGYVHVPSYLTPPDVARLAAWVDDLAARDEAPGRHWVYYEEDLRRPDERVLSRIENFCPHHSELAALLGSERIMLALQQLFGEPAVLFKDKINYKVPGSGGFEAHQDVQAGWDRYAPLHITLLISVDAATTSNGCLEMAPGWHDRGLLGKHWAPLGNAVPGSAYRSCPTAAGDAVFFDSFIPHRSEPNATDAARRVLYVTYNGISAGDQRARYYADKHASFPPDIEREGGREYRYRV